MKLRMQFLVLYIISQTEVDIFFLNDINIYDINFVCYKNIFHDESNYTYLVIININTFYMKLIKLKWFDLVLC